MGAAHPITQTYSTKREGLMPQMPEEIKRRLAEVSARFMLKHNVPYEDITEFIQDISTILFDYMDIPLEED